MPELGGEYEILRSEPREGFLESYWVRGREGEGRLYWFEVHDPEARAAFFRYRNALKRLERLGALPGGVRISARPGRYFVFWPEAGDSTPPKGRRARRRLAEIEAALRPFGYRLEAALLGQQGGRPVVRSLHPLPTGAPEPEAPPKPSPARSLRAWLPGTLLAALGLVLLGVGAQRYLNPPSYPIPDVVGMPATKAERALAGKGLTLVFSEESHPDAPAGVVIRVTPAPGSRIKPGRRVELVVNRPEVRQVPAVNGKTLDQARALLAQAGYAVGPVAQTYDPSPAGTVLSSLPPAGTPLPAEAEVRLLVSLGPAPQRTLVPDLKGTSPEEARRLLELAGLQAGQEETLPSPLPEGTLLAQSPRPGTVIETGAPVVTARAAHPEVLLPPAPPEPPTPEGPEPPPAPETQPEPEGSPVPLDLSLPEELVGKPVKLTVTDDGGTRVLYQGPTQKGWRLSGEVPVRGQATFRLYVGDALYKEWRVPP